jgi:hypothetical protein
MSIADRPLLLSPAAIFVTAIDIGARAACG